ncbi:MAG: peptide ABC transporter substrate-binding protein [Thermoprotei archaeon]|nr:MAG: peptide ABC transporter substrate-binding protein [Thermoprotei archaeon]
MNVRGLSKLVIVSIVIVIAVVAGIAIALMGVMAPKRMTVVVIGTLDPVVHLDPRKAYEFMSCEVLYNVFDTLVRYDDVRKEYIPWLAERWDVSPDGKVWTFYLRKGVKFHDGTELTAEDVKYTFESALKMFKEGVAEPAWMIESVFERVEVVDKYTVRFYVKVPSLVLPVLSFTVCAPVPKEAAERLGEKFDLKPVGTGPFKVVEFKPDEYLILEKFEDYWNKEAAAKVDRIIIKFFRDASALRMALEKREVDIAFRHLNIEDYADLEKKTNLVVIKGRPPFIRYLIINCKKLPDVRVRKALAYILHSIAVPEIVEKVFKGYAEPLYSLVTPCLEKYFKPVFKKYVLPPDEAKAKAIELLRAAGYSESKKLKLILGYSLLHYGPLEPYVAEVIKSALETTGLIEVETKGEEWGTFKKHFREGVFDIHLLGWYPDYFDPDNYLYPFLHSSSSGPVFGCFYANPEVDKLLEEAQKVVDVEKRAELYHKVQVILAEDVPIIPLWIPTYEYAIVFWKDIKGIRLTLEGILWLYEISK